MKYKVMVVLDVFSGLRLGELMGLSWDNIDMQEHQPQWIYMFTL